MAGDGSQGFETQIPAEVGETTPLTIRAIAPDGVVQEERKRILNQQGFRYDENGNLVQDAERIYVWDAENRLTKVVWLSVRPSRLPTVVEMEYDGEGRRVRIVAKHGDTVLSDKRFVWCDGVQPCEERDADGNVVKRFYEQGFQVVTVAQTENFYYTKDHLGSIREVVDSTTVVRARYDYDPWGRRTKLDGDVHADFGFTGFYHDTASGLDLTWYRAYSAEMGRWLSRDPIEEQDGHNLYRIVLNAPNMYMDLSGMKVYICQRPLEAFGGSGRKSGPEGSKNPFFHKYICVNETCGGQGPAEGKGILMLLFPFLPVKGQPTDDKFSKENCDEIESCPEMEQCLLEKFAGPRPKYCLTNLFGGINCQRWADQILAECAKKCKKDECKYGPPAPWEAGY